MAALSGHGRDGNSVNVGEVVHKECEDAQLQMRNSLLEHLQRLVGREDFSDLEFVCRDGDKVKASKILLSGRSPVLDKILTSGMLESSLSVIKLPEISSPVLLYILDILYAGNSVQHPLGSWTTALEAMSAAHFFLLPLVNKIVQKFMLAQVEQVTKKLDLTSAARMLTAAVDQKCIIHDEDVVLLELVRLVRSKWMELDCVFYLSEEALDFILRNTKPNNGTDFRLDEYYRVRGIVLWGICIDATDDLEHASNVETLLNNFMPSSEADLYKVSAVDDDNTHIDWLPRLTASRYEQVCEALTSEVLRDSIARLLSNINWLCIPVSLIVKTVGRLRFLSPLRYLDVLEDHAGHTPVRLTCRWTHSLTCTADLLGFVISKNEYGEGWALCQVTPRSQSTKLRWRFRLDAMGRGKVRLGVACGELDYLSDKVMKGKLLREDWSKVHLMDVGPSDRTGSYGWGDESPSVTTDYVVYRDDDNTEIFCSPPSVLFTCDQEKRVCTISVGHYDSFMTWENLPPGDIFPVVDLGYTSGARVRIEIVDGFNIF